MQGEEQSYNDLFSAVEQIKNGHIIDVMYGKYNESIFQPSMGSIFTNNKIADFFKYLSADRWEVYTISPDGYFAKPYSPYEHLRLEDLLDQQKNNAGPLSDGPTLDHPEILDEK